MKLGEAAGTAAALAVAGEVSLAALETEVLQQALQQQARGHW
jgi:hypothetical protein